MYTAHMFDPKPGVKTTEFITVIAQGITSALILSNVARREYANELTNVIILAVTIITVLSTNAAVIRRYIDSRTKIKTRDR